MEQLALLAVCKCKVKKLDLTPTLECHHGVPQLDIEGSVCVEPKLERDSGAKKRLDRTCKYLSYITDECVLWLAVAILQTLLEGGVHVQESSYQVPPGTYQPPHMPRGVWQYHSCKA